MGIDRLDGGDNAHPVGWEKARGVYNIKGFHSNQVLQKRSEKRDFRPARG